jgi:O-antigen ligase
MRHWLDFAQAPGENLTRAILPMALFAYAIGILTLPMLPADEQIALGLILLVPALLVGLYVVTKTLLGDRICGVIVAVICIFIVAANFRARAYDDKSIDWQVALKLLAITLFLGMAVIFVVYAFSRRLYLGRLFYAWLLFFAWLVVCSLYSETPTFALTCTISLFGAYLYTVYMAVWLSRIRTIEIMVLVALLMCVGSIVVYFAVPSVGRMQAWMQGAGFGDTGRLKGLSGSPNGIGMVAAFSILLAVVYYREISPFGRRLALALIPCAFTVLVLSNNRGGMLTLAVAMWSNFVLRGGTAFKVALSVTGGLAGIAMLMSFPDQILSALSRSGEASEITSVTGRSSIWAVVIELWAQRPLLGHGYASSLSILPLDPRLFGVAAHSHNMYLELLFGGGIVVLGIFLYGTFQTLLAMYRLGAVSEATLFVFFLVRGVTESGPFNAMIAYNGFAFSMTIALVILKVMDAREKSLVARPFTATRVAPALRPSRA